MNSISDARLSWIDWSKTILIYLMVVGHTGISGLSEQFIISFHMPAFFIISGFLYKPKDWKQTMKSFLVPILAYSSIAFIIYGTAELFQSNGSGFYIWTCKSIETLFLRGIKQTNLFQGVLFLEVLLLLRLVFGDIPFMRCVYKHYKVTFLIFFTLSIVLSSVYVPEYITNIYVFRFITCLPFFAFGILIKEYDVIEQLKTSSWIVTLLLLVAFIVSVLTNEPLRIYSNLYGSSYCQSFISAVLGSLLLYNLCLKLPRSIIVENISTGTLFVLGTHSLLFIPFFRFLQYFNISSYLRFFLAGLFVLLICYYPIVLLKKNCPVLLGKVPRNDK